VVKQQNIYGIMYVIAVYDINEKRVGKMLKLCRRHLNWIQNSVFEGELTDLGLKELIYESKQIMDEREDSFILFSSRESRWLTKTIVGREKSEVDNFLWGVVEVILGLLWHLFWGVKEPEKKHKILSINSRRSPDVFVPLQGDDF